MSDNSGVAKLDNNGQGNLIETPIELVTRALFGNRYSSKKNRLYMKAFYLDEERIRELNDRAMEYMLKQSILPGSNVHFTATVRFADNSSQDFVNLERMLKRSADERDPESVIFAWKALISGHGSMISCIEASFVTEKRLKTGSVSAYDFSVAYMQLEVYSADEGWVEETFAKVKGIFESAKLHWMYAPLLLFRNRTVVQLVAQALAWSGFFIFTNQVTALMKAMYANPVSVLKNLLAQGDLNQKIDLLSQYLISPTDNPWWSIVVILGGGTFVYLALLFALLFLLPMLVPRSIIAIGLVKHKIAFLGNVIKFVILSGFVSGLMIPALRSVVPAILKALLKHFL